MSKNIYDPKTGLWSLEIYELLNGKREIFPYATIEVVTEDDYNALCETLEKNIEKEPLGVDLHGRESGNIHKFVCPECDNFLANRRKVNEANNDFIPSYCPVCGQKLDWSDID